MSIWSRRTKNSEFRESLTLAGLYRPVFAGLVVGWLLTSFLILSFVVRNDQAALDRDRTLVVSLVEQVQERLRLLVHDYAFWSDSIGNLLERPDPAWADLTIGASMAETFEVSRVFVVGGDDRLRLVYVYGQLVDVPEGVEAMDGLKRLAAAVRRTYRAIEDSTVSPGIVPPEPRSHLMMIDGQLHVAAASVFVHDDPRVNRQLDSSRPVLIIAKALGYDFFHMARTQFGLHDFAFSPQGYPHAGSIRVVDAEGRRIGFFNWSPAEGGKRFLRLIFLPLLITFASSLGLIALFFYRARILVTTRRELAEAAALASEANAAKSRFLAAMSHELRTPLNAVIGFAQLLGLEKGMRPEKVAEYGTHIEESGRHLLHLVDEILEFSQLDDGERSPKPVEVPINQLGEFCLSIFEAQARKKGIRLRFRRKLPVGQDWFLTDPAMLRRILLSLLANAIQYNQPGGLVEFGFKKAPHGRLRLSVKDDGPGIAPTDLETIFTPFRRLKPGDGDDLGAGIGLALVKRLVEILDGTIEVDSEPGVGSLFEVYLPPWRPDRHLQVTPPSPSTR